ANQGGASSKAEGKDPQSKGEEAAREDEPGADGEDEPMSKTSMAAFVAVLGLAGFCGYHIIRELFPTRMSPNAIFNRAFEDVQSDPDVCNHFGTPLTAYGRDSGGGSREGRRNFVEHEEYVAPDDVSNRCRVRFNLKGPHGHAHVFAEVSSKMGKDEWVYLMVQDLASGHVINLHDNRAAIAAGASAESDEERSAIGRLL
ncbi:unnamed protein product, partial [Phaeothamnion confervicola]